MSNTLNKTPCNRKVLAAGLLSLALGTSALTVLPFTGQAQTAPGQSAPGQSTPDTAITLPRQAGPVGFGDLAARVAPAVVRVTVTGEAPAAAVAEIPPELRGTPLEPFFRRFQQQQRPGQPGPRQAPQGRARMGQGSGFIIDAAGYIVTNNHVVGDAATVRVELADGRDLPARVVGRDQQTDLALLKVESGSPLPTLTWGDSDATRVGDWVVAMGNPFGLGGSVTAGIVSARGRQIGAGPYDDFIQTDAPINPGNSGGPLFNGNGEVVGINTAIYAPGGGNVGIGFAVPSRMARHVIEDLQRDGVVARGWLGVAMQPIDSELAAALRLPNQRGALVASVEPDSPAARAGLRAGDVVVGLEGKEIGTPRELALAVAELEPESRATFTLLRDGQRTEQAVTIGLRAQPQQQAEAQQEAERPGSLGLRLAPAQRALPNSKLQGQDAAQGVQVAGVDPGSVAASRGVRPGDVILRAGGREVSSPRDVMEAVAAARREGRPAIALQLSRESGNAFVALPLEGQG
ncbi:Do family serine endopeptidase [Roseomonas frigidaquae]|uniref:Probable periplasmic serine endoprotease DegP-like n=1 Tax=Falsiroseomonas frigidaquae TaxID=487318 RepID=A0ABX1EY40_9PROT|nr:Do family serine endopeptidase [Falsiroseomonas frigidaquae]NKE45018.1 Do family serine endopeptidase [Falsiroseomonas frigidaquae]